MKKRKWWVVSSIIWMAVIFLCTQLPYFTGDSTAEAIHKTIVPGASQGSVDILNLIMRKMTHITAFGLLAFFLAKSLAPKRFAYLFSFLFTVVYAMSDEWHQSFMPGRVASFEDVLFDSFGALLALAILYFYNKSRKRE